jgi:hypothetical protein
MEQARYTLDENMLRKPQMNPDMMIEQLLAASDYWDKFAKTLTGAQKRQDAEELPFTPYGKYPKGGSGGGGHGAASGSAHTNGGGRREERRPDSRRADDRGSGRPAGASGGNGGRGNNPRGESGNRTPAPHNNVEPNPFDKQGWETRGTYANNHSLWVHGSTRQQRQELANSGKCSICRSSDHVGRNCSRMAQMFSAKKTCYFKRN